MSDPIISLDTIARQASEAASQWERGTPPPNPWDAITHPEHHSEWNRRFCIALARLPAADQLEGAAL